MTNTRHVIPLAITSIDSTYETLLNVNIFQEKYLKVIKMLLKYGYKNLNSENKAIKVFEYSRPSVIWASSIQPLRTRY